MSFSIKYFSLDKTLFFNATIVVKERVGDVESMFTYTYDINIGWARHRSGWDYILFVQKQNAVLSPSTGNLADTLIAELGEPANYLEITIHKNAQKKLSNIQDIIDKWQVKYKQLMHTYQGDWAKAIIDQTTNAYKNETAILEHFITKDWILNTYFMGIYDVTFDYSGRSTNNQHLLHNALGNTVCQFNESYRYSKTAKGCTIDIQGKANTMIENKPQNAWLYRKLGSASAGHPPLQLNAVRNGVYEMSNETSWCHGFSITNILTIEDKYTKEIQLNLTPVL